MGHLARFCNHTACWAGIHQLPIAFSIHHAESALTCRGLKMFILDLNVFAEQAGYPTCTSEEKFVVDAKLGIVYLRIGEHHPDLPNKPDYYSVHHKFGTHAAPWYVAQVCIIMTCRGALNDVIMPCILGCQALPPPPPPPHPHLPQLGLPVIQAEDVHFQACVLQRSRYVDKSGCPGQMNAPYCFTHPVFSFLLNCTQWNQSCASSGERLMTCLYALLTVLKAVS